jgi:type IV pilus assembly protein PilA
MELLIVVAIVGIISAVALPQFLSVKVAAEATTSIAEVLSLASQCAVANKSGIPETVSQPFNGGARVCDGQSLRRINSREWSGDASGVKCLDRTAGPTNRRVRVTVRVDGTLTCQFF